MKYFVKTVKIPHDKTGTDPAEYLELPDGQRIVSAIGATAPMAHDTHIQLVVLIEETQYAKGGVINKPYEVREGC